MIGTFTDCSCPAAYTVTMSPSAPPGLLMLLVLLVAVVPPGCTREERSSEAPAADIDLGGDKVRPLSEALALARRVAEGRVIDVELESDIDENAEDAARVPRWVYEIEILTADNRVVEVEIDALTLQLLEVDGAPWPAGIPRPEVAKGTP
jgi:hypothetical protein